MNRWAIFVHVKRTPLFITLGLFVLLAGSFFGYQYFFKTKATSLWEVVPEQTVLVYEAGDCATCTGEETASTALLTNLTLELSPADSITKKLHILEQPGRGKAISLHVTGKDDFDVVYYFFHRKAEQFSQVTTELKKTKGVRFAERKLNGATISEFSFNANGISQLLSCVQLGDAWAASFTPFLIEDVVRTFERKGEQYFKQKLSGVYTLPRVKDDAGDVYVNLENLNNWLKVFPADAGFSLQKIGDGGLLDIKFTEQSTTLNGFSLTQQPNGLLGYFLHQAPVQFTIKQYIPNQTVFAVNYGVSDGAKFYQNLNLSKNKVVQDSLAGFAQIDYAQLFASFGREMVVCYQESKGNALSKVIVFETQKPADWLSAFDKLSQAAEKEDSVFLERYSTYEIREIEINNLSGKLFEPLISGIGPTYYTSIGNYIILADRLENVKRFLEDVDQENVWGKSVAFNKFLESTLLESNLSVYVNTPLVWNTTTSKLNPRWRDFIKQNQSLLNSFDLGAIQFSHLNESFYTNITWTHGSVGKSQNKPQPKAQANKLVASLNAPVITRPYVVRSHVNRDDEVLVQDSTFTVYHLSAEGKILWQKKLESSIVGEVHQVDFYNNGKMQFFFATRQALHVIDRLGNYVTPYPQAVRIKDLEYAGVVDYDKSKKYRFLLSDKSGKLWIFDKEAKNLEGWTPKQVGDDLFAAPRHYRIRGKDYMVAIRNDGHAYLMNRRGETLKGFPLDLDMRPGGDYYLETGNSLATTNFVCVARDGFRVKFNLDGKILSRETLIKPSFDTQFALVREENSKSYLLKRQDAKRLTLLSEDNRELLSNDFIGTNAVDVRYYDFGAGKVYISITDRVQDVIFVYDGTGNMLTPTPIQGSAVELRPTKDAMPKMFIIDENTLVIQ